MALVRSLALECGVRRLPDGKVIWFQIGDPPERPVDDRFLAMWNVDETNAASTEPAGMRVGLINVPATLWLAARQHHDALLRELHLFQPGARFRWTSLPRIGPAGTSATR